MATPNLTLDPDVQSKLTQAIQMGDDPAAAAVAAQKYQQQKGSPSLVLQAAQESQSPSLIDKVGSWIKNNGATVGSIAGGLAGAALAPETGGLSLALPAILAAGGATAGNVASQAANGQDIGSSQSLESDLGQAALGGVTDLGGGLLGGIIGKAGGAAADAFSKESDNLALKGLGATPNQLANFATKHAIVDEAGNATPDALIKWVNANGLAGQGVDGITSKLNDLQGQFNGIVKDSNIPVDPAKIQANMESKIAPFNSSPDPADAKIAATVDANFQNVNKLLGPNPTLEQVNDLRQFYDGKTNYTLSQQDPQQFGPYKVVADALRGTVQDAADSTGAATAAGSLKETGQQLSKLYDLQQIAERSGFKGVSTSTPGLTNYMASAALGNVAGPAGAIIGAAVPAFLNNPAAISALSKGFGAAGDVTGAVASKVGGALASPLGVAAQQAVIGGGANAALAASNQPGSTPSSTSLGQPASTLPSTPSLSSGDLVSQGVQALQSGQPLTQNQYQALLEKDLVTDGGRFSAQITAAYNAGNPSAVQGIGVAANAANVLQNLYDTAGGAQGKISGSIQNALGSTGLTSQNVQAYNNQKLALGQEIISQIYGSSGTASDRDEVLNLIPNVDDSKEVANSKMQTLRTLIQQRLSSLTDSTPSSVSALSNGPSLNLTQ